MIQYQQSHELQFEEINQCVYSTFSDSEGMEVGKIIENLVAQLQQTEEECIGFIAQESDCIIASVFFSRFVVEGSDVKSYLLSPMAVITKHQKKGIGQALIRFGIEQLKQQGAELLLTYGDPAFYGKVGFQPITEKIVQAPLKLSYPHGWLAQSLIEENIPVLKGKTHCVLPLNDANLW